MGHLATQMEGTSALRYRRLRPHRVLVSSEWHAPAHSRPEESKTRLSRTERFRCRSPTWRQMYGAPGYALYHSPDCTNRTQEDSYEPTIRRRRTKDEQKQSGDRADKSASCSRRGSTFLAGCWVTTVGPS